MLRLVFEQLAADPPAADFGCLGADLVGPCVCSGPLGNISFIRPIAERLNRVDDALIVPLLFKPDKFPYRRAQPWDTGANAG